MKWSRKSQEFSYADYVSGDYRVRDMSMHRFINGKDWWAVNGKRGYWWALIKVDSTGTETVVAHSFKTAKAAKQYAETI